MIAPTVSTLIRFISKPLRDARRAPFHPMALVVWLVMGVAPAAQLELLAESPSFMTSQASDRSLVPVQHVGDDMVLGACGSVDITQNTDPNTVLGPAFAVACYNSANNCTVANEFARSFNLAVGATAGQAHFVRCVEYAVESATDTLDGLSPVTVSLFRDASGGAPDTASLVALAGGSIVDQVPDGTATALRSVDFTANNVLVPADATLVVVVSSPDLCTAQGINNVYFNGANNAGQSAPSYIKAAGCGIPDFVTLAGIGFPLQHMVMTVELDPAAGFDPPTVGDNTCQTSMIDTGIPCSTDADCTPPAVCGTMSRYGGITPTNAVVAGPSASSIQVEIVSMPQFVARQGEIWWAGPEVAIPNSPHASVRGAGLVCTGATPHSQVWTSGTLYLFGTAMIPSAEYNVRMCDASGANCSDPLLIATGEWGDIVRPFGGISQPNFNDINEIIFKFINLGSSLPMPRVDLAGPPGNPGVPNAVTHVANFLDITLNVDAFVDSGNPLAYPFTVLACP